MKKKPHKRDNAEEIVPHAVDEEELTPDVPEDVAESLDAIFRDEKGNVPDLTTLEPRRSGYWIAVLIGLATFLLLLIVAAWVGFLYFKPFHGFAGKGFDLAVDGPDQIKIGEEQTYFVNWKNTTNEPIATAGVRVTFPPDFTVTSVDPPPTDPNVLRWDIGTIPFGGRGTFTVKGIFMGGLGTKTAIQAVGSYRPASFNSDFEALTTRAVTYGSSVLEGSIDSPEKIMPGDAVRFAYHVINHGLSTLKGLEAHVTVPAGFVRDATTSSSALDEGIVRIPVGTLEAGASTTVAVQGVFASGHAGDAVIHAEIGTPNADGSFYSEQVTDATSTILSGDLTVKLVANGSDQGGSVGYGDAMHFSVGFENTAAESINDISLKFRIDPIMASGTTAIAAAKSIIVDWSHFEDSTSSTRSGNSLTWDKGSLGLLAKLSPQQDGTLDLTLPIVTSASATPAIIGFQAIVEGTMASVGTTKIDRTIRSAPLVFRFRSDASLTAEARYFSEEGAPYGSGPLPPVSGQTTSYRILWDLTKSVHELKNVVVTAVLPPRVSWPAKSAVTAGDVSYDDASRTVTWTLNRLPSDVNEAIAQFQVDFSPSDADANRFGNLLGDTHVSATDADLSEQILKSRPALTTDLENDDAAKGKGVVRTP